MQDSLEHDDPGGRIGRYEVLRKIATGGMAELFLAKQVGMEGFEKVVAIKRILAHLAFDEEFIGMFRDEARIVAKLSHPNIVQIYDLGKSDESYFIAMEYIPGRNLSSIAKKARARGERLPPTHIARCVAQACEGLYYAHTRRDIDGRDLEIIHRDVSPQNIIVSFSGSVKLVDFGIAKAASKVAHTRAGVLKGKYAYMSPEQIRGETIDARSDLFSVGIVLYELLCGRRPFEKSSSIQTLKAIVQEEPVPCQQLAPEIPDELAEIIHRCLAKDKNVRWQSAQEVQIALEDFVGSSKERCNNITISNWLSQLFEQELSREKGGTVVFQGVGEVILPEVQSGGSSSSSSSSDGIASGEPEASPSRPELIEEAPIGREVEPEPEGGYHDKATVHARSGSEAEAQLGSMHDEPEIGRELQPESYDDQATAFADPVLPPAKDESEHSSSFAIDVEADGLEPFDSGGWDAPTVGRVSETPLPAPVPATPVDDPDTADPAETEPVGSQWRALPSRQPSSGLFDRLGSEAGLDDEDFGDATVAMPSLQGDESHLGALSASLGEAMGEALGQAPGFDPEPSHADDDDRTLSAEELASLLARVEPSETAAPLDPVAGADATLATPGLADATLATPGLDDATLAQDSILDDATLAQDSLLRDAPPARPGEDASFGFGGDMTLAYGDDTIARPSELESDDFEDEDPFEPPSDVLNDATLAMTSEQVDQALDAANLAEQGFGQDIDPTVGAMDEEPSLPGGPMPGPREDSFSDDRTMAGVTSDYLDAGADVPEGGAYDPLPDLEAGFAEAVPSPIPSPRPSRNGQELGAIALERREVRRDSDADLLIDPDLDLDFGEPPPPASDSREARDEYSALLSPSSAPPRRAETRAEGRRSSPARLPELQDGRLPPASLSLSQVLANPMGSASAQNGGASYAGTSSRLQAIPRAQPSQLRPEASRSTSVIGRQIREVVRNDSLSGAPPAGQGSFVGQNPAAFGGTHPGYAPYNTSRGMPLVPPPPPPRASWGRRIGLGVALLAAIVVLAGGLYFALPFVMPADPRLTIKTEPEGATVRVNGAVQTGRTPLTIRGLTPGVTYQVQLERAGYQNVRQDVKLPSERPLIWSIRLEPTNGG